MPPSVKTLGHFQQTQQTTPNKSNVRTTSQAECLRYVYRGYRQMRRIRTLHFVVGFLIAGAVTGLAEPDDQLSALTIFDRALSEFESSRVALSKWQYYQTLTTHQLDSAGKVTAKGTWHSIVRPGDPQPLEYISKSVEGRISFFEGGTDDSSGSPSTTQPSKSNAGTERNQSESAVEAVRKYDLRGRYVWTQQPDETVNGESVYVLSFQPKPGQHVGSREERFFSLLAGKLWISRDDFSVLKARAALQSPCHLFWIIARVTTFEMNYELRPTSGNRLFRLSQASAKTVVKFPFYAVRQRHWQTVDKYEPRTPRGSSSSR